MKRLCLLGASLALLVLIVALGLLGSGRTALLTAAGLTKVAAAAAAVAVAAALARHWVGRLEQRPGRRWVLAGRPVTWLLTGTVLLAALALVGATWQRAARPSLHGDWSIGIYLSAGTEPADFGPLGPQPVLTAASVTDLPCAFVADPVLVRAASGYTLFFEAWNRRTGQGDICVASSEDGRTWVYGGRVLDEPCSLSYPTVFNHEGTWYMVPETRELAELRLYRAERFPDRWVLDRVLLDGARYRDTNLFAHEGHWYLLTCTGYGYDLLAFHADDPRGPWRPHPANPVVTGDGDHARGGGSVQDHRGRLIRFVQDVTPYYGNRVRAVTVGPLTPTTYVQAPVGPDPVLVGHDAWNVRGLHTLWCVRRDDGRWLAAVDGHGRLIDTKRGS
jgi:hypothetical protein